MKNFIRTILTFVVVSIPLTAVIAQQSGHLKLSTIVQKEQLTTTPSGEQKKELVAATTVVPGDSVIYTIAFENVGEEPAENVTITNPVPDNLSYEDGSAFGPGSVIEFSVDGGEVFAAAADLKVTENGELRTAGPGDYTHIRWVMQHDLAVGEQGVARFRARLN